ncbi:hypothetical protein GYMLUDRAFT_45863 [Collybiopsis luxurians FD-317 M1]|uniref:Enoyl reductase (ER) domain-containing protein n=1 Tax=Collybiopsis luxurians FD-317 M1 TaxID=944289 RepID=A0A0D0BR48_9AGAR|nr:hypothetical protein GYMLUDRAFT_45863 [Collybiopsis luxurians FD-317 M1]
MTSKSQLPPTTKAIVVRKRETKSSNGYVNDAALEVLPIPQLEPGQLLVKINAAGFNHRDVWIRRGQYPAILAGAVYGADGAGVVIASGDANDKLLNQRVFLTPSHGWDSDPDAPESIFSVIGGVAWPSLGTFAQYVVVDRDEVIPSAPHLSDIHMAAWPVAGITAWRATMVNAAVKPGQNILITGIGGGVALTALQLAVAQGALVYVTSGSQDKIDKAIKLGASGGTSYKNSNWPKEIHKLVMKNTPAGFPAVLDAVIDSGGGEIMASVSSILKQGGRVVCYGMTANPKITFTMREVLRNQKLLGSTMGSKQDLRDATEFLSKHKIVPVVSNVFKGLESAEKGFEVLRSGEQFGKVVIEIAGDSSAKAKL